MGEPLRRPGEPDRPQSSAAWRVGPGRRLRRSPPWEPDAEGVIVFDAASGDYWLLGPAADRQLRAVEAAGADGARSEVAGDTGMLSELQRCGLVEPVA